MKSIVLLVFSIVLSFAIVVVENSSLSRKTKTNITGLPINYCPNPESFGTGNLSDLRKKILQKPGETLSNNMKRLKKVGNLVMTINKMFKHRPGIPKELSDRDLNNSIRVYLKSLEDNEFVKNEFKNMLNKKKDSFPQSYDWVEEAPKCFEKIAEQQQGSCGSCYIFSTVNYFSILRCFDTEEQILTPLSTQDVLSCMKTENKWNNCEGGSPIDVWRNLYEKGVVSQSCKCYKDYDYEEKKESQSSSNKYMKKGGDLIQKCENCYDSTIKPIHFKTHIPEMIMTTGSGRTISTLLYNYGILIGSLSYNTRFEKYYVIVGYKFRLNERCIKELFDFEKAVNCFYFKILNSWGKEFGKNGYGYVPDTLVSSTYFGFATKDQLKRFISETDMKKDIYSFTKNSKSGLKLQDILNHHLKN